MTKQCMTRLTAGFPELPAAVRCAVPAVCTAAVASGLLRGAGPVSVSSRKDLSGAASQGGSRLACPFARGVARYAGSNDDYEEAD